MSGARAVFAVLEAGVAGRGSADRAAFTFLRLPVLTAAAGCDSIAFTILTSGSLRSDSGVAGVP